MFLLCGGAGPGDAIALHTALVWVYSVNQEMLRVNTSVRRVPAGGWQEGLAVQGEHAGGQGWSPPAAPRSVPREQGSSQGWQDQEERGTGGRRSSGG